MFVSILNRSMFRNPICAILLIFVYRIEFTLTEQPLNDHDHHPILHHSSWFIHFIKNLTDYFVIIIPVGLLVFLAKRDLLPSYVKHIRWIKLLVYGVPASNELPLTIEDGSLLLSSEADEENLKSNKPQKVREKNTNVFHLFYCFFGLQISFLTWGILQEKIMTQNYAVHSSFIDTHSNQITENLLSIISVDSLDPNMINIKFRNAQFLVLINRVLAFIIAVIVLLYQQNYHSSHQHKSFFRTKQPPFYMYIYCSLSNIMSSWCQYEALKYVSFPAQVLSKGCKMIPTMLMNRILMGRTQKREEWLFAIAISFGMSIFMLNEQRESHHVDDTINDSFTFSSFISGIIILVLYLTFDSFTSNWQQSLFDQYRSLTSLHMMAAVNFYSILFTLVSLLQQSDFFPSLSLLFANPALMRDCIILSICSAGGQLFIFHTISTYGAIIFTLIMTLRQAFAILLSCFIYSHSITWLGLLGIVIIFASLFFKSYRKFDERRSKTSMVNSKQNHQNV
ncbi:adenosine 3'-phospho 5'-phosphosulfate transporter 1 [Dermatophagoides farinae]|nr:adenosine 3'-phospho 5'-phosphosulfate transporter 1-like [Dermatophagoides farinae]